MRPWRAGWEGRAGSRWSVASRAVSAPFGCPPSGARPRFGKRGCRTPRRLPPAPALPPPSNCGLQLPRPTYVRTVGGRTPAGGPSPKSPPDLHHLPVRHFPRVAPPGGAGRLGLFLAAPGVDRRPSPVLAAYRSRLTNAGSGVRAPVVAPWERGRVCVGHRPYCPAGLLVPEVAASWGPQRWTLTTRSGPLASASRYSVFMGRAEAEVSGWPPVIAGRRGDGLWGGGQALWLRERLGNSPASSPSSSR